MNKKVVLCDVDGVLTNSVIDKVIEYANNKFNTNYQLKDMTGDFRKVVKEWDEEGENLIKSEGFCRDFIPIKEGQDAIEELRKKYQVVFLTSPLDGSPTWGFDRFEWLKEHFDAKREEVIITKGKKYVDGYILIDDLPDNIFSWSAYNKKPAMMFSRPWNINHGAKQGVDFMSYEDQKGKQVSWRNVEDWDKILSILN